MREHQLTSRALDERQFAEFVEALPTTLRDLLGDAIVVCEYGALSKLHLSLWHVPMEVGLEWLHRFLRESIEQQIFEPGGSDLLITTRDGTLEVHLCHEADIHLSGTDHDLVRRLAAHPLVSRLFEK